jgi:hypothetical protein
MSNLRIASLAVVTLLLGGRTLLAEENSRASKRANAAYVKKEARGHESSKRLERTLPSAHGRGSAATRDDDHDGIPNRRDPDDDNNGVTDDLE